MPTTSHGHIPDRTPIIVGSGQIIDRLTPASLPPYLPPMGLAARATEVALEDSGAPELRKLIDTIAVLRLFSDSVGLWQSPLGRSDNPPASVAHRIRSSAQRLIYTNTGGTQPLQLVMELALDIARGNSEVALLTGAEAIGSEKHARRGGHEDDWNEHFDIPFEDREYLRRFACIEERNSGMTLPVHYYALIENIQAHEMGFSRDEHRRYMAELLAPMSVIAAQEPVALDQQVHTVEQLLADDRTNFPISLPLTRMLVSKDTVNQGASVLLTSVGKARELGIPPQQWTFIHGYAQGEERHLMRRQNPAESTAMKGVFDMALSMADTTIDAVDLIDIYSCFPCAVSAGRDSLGMKPNDSRSLTVIGGLPFYGGAGNGYSLHALARMCHLLRDSERVGAVTANTGVMSKHALAVLSNVPNTNPNGMSDWATLETPVFDLEQIPQKEIARSPKAGTIVTYTVIYGKNEPDLAIILGETGQGERFLAHSAEHAVAEALHDEGVIGRRVTVLPGEERHSFSMAL